MRRLALLLLTAACSGGSDSPTSPSTDNGEPVDALPVASVTVTAASSQLAAGASQQLIASTRDSGGNQLANRVVTWSTSDAGVVTVSATGLATAVASGTATVTATSEQRTGTIVLTVSGGALYTALGTILTPADFGVATGLPVADATAIQLTDGRVRLYVFAQGQGTRSAISTDATGTSFTPEPGVRSTTPTWGQPRIIRLADGRVRLYYTSGDGIRSAVSTDGLTFSEEPGLRIANAALGYDAGAISIVPLAGGGYRGYFSDLEKPGMPPGGHFIRSALSDDLLNWTIEPGIVAGVGATGGVNQTATHPFAFANADGSVTLYYQGERPEPGSNTSYRGLFRSTSTDGRTFATEERTGIPFGGDPDVIRLANGSVLMYYGDFDPKVGGIIQLARRNP